MRALVIAVAATCAVVTDAATGSTTEQYFQTSPELFAGPRITGKPAFLAQTNPAPFPSVSYAPPEPLETQVPISGAPSDGSANIFRLHGQLSHYFPNPVGFGVDEYPLPEGAEITQLHMLHRHGARYPTGPMAITKKLEESKFTAEGELKFLNSWKNKLGEAILVPVGQQELFDSGVLHRYLYGHLYPNDGKKIIARSTTQDRMTQSAEYFLAGFFGLEWPRNASLELIIEKQGFNNSLAGYFKCPNNGKPVSLTGSQARSQWAATYLADAQKRLNKLITFEDSSTELTLGDVYSFQSLCPYETVALGYSAFCNLFTYDEWQGYEYSIDLDFAGNSGFQSPTSRGVGIGYVQELRARLLHHYVSKDEGGPANTTLDNMQKTFPLDQTLYFDFSHDTNIMTILVALGLKQFNGFLPATHILEDRELVVSHMEPFAGRLDIEIITAPHPVSPRRSHSSSSSPVDVHEGADYEPEKGGKTKYIHFLLNQRTVPLGRSYEICGDRDDGWCELDAFLKATESAFEESQYDYACFGEYPVVPYGDVTNGVPVKSNVNSTSGDEHEDHSADHSENKSESETWSGGDPGVVEGQVRLGGPQWPCDMQVICDIMEFLRYLYLWSADCIASVFGGD